VNLTNLFCATTAIDALIVQICLVLYSRIIQATMHAIHRRHRRKERSLVGGVLIDICLTAANLHSRPCLDRNHRTTRVFQIAGLPRTQNMAIDNKREQWEEGIEFAVLIEPVCSAVRN
jgi:hypothetical protein